MVRAAVSTRAAVAAAALVVLHLAAAFYVRATDMAYDQNDALGLLWWLVAFWVLPVIAAIVLILSFTKQLLNRNNGGQ